MTQTMTAQASGFDEVAEAEEAYPHRVECFQWYAEELVEAGIAELGRHDEMLRNGQIVMARFHMEMIEETATCHCGSGWEEEE
jgi:hypothetical protein